MGDYKVDIPIVATRPAASIQFNKLANFGFIAEGIYIFLPIQLLYSHVNLLTQELYRVYMSTLVIMVSRKRQSS